jgi:hypothetical protein
MFRVQHLGLPERVPEDHPADHSRERAEHVTSAPGRGQATGTAPQVNTWDCISGSILVCLVPPRSSWFYIGSIHLALPGSISF